MRSPLLYYVEDDPDFLEVILCALRSGGFEAKGFLTAKELYDALAVEKPAILCIDLTLPDEDGLALLRKLKENAATSQIPIIVLSANSNNTNIVRVLDAGADDYLIKPFDLMVLLARIRSVLRRVQDRNVLVANEIYLDPDRYRVRIDGEYIPLTRKEFQLLEALMEARGTVLSRNTLLDRVWGSDYRGETRTLDVHIRTLRHKLLHAGSRIVTVRGIGYQMN